ncbi:hypothetical protein B0H63DRAFT_487858 [Podospora didyma]|uniref:Glutamate--tRNA ligase, mitochondrial n=1 Tax=Podospora didyma TaxID=330526 RepID=A0AAE0N2C8_9PEZI|nr:hypothetical protein B0H63DRAFT_487858 [Podospora didyma]
MRLLGVTRRPACLEQALLGRKVLVVSSLTAAPSPSPAPSSLSLLLSPSQRHAFSASSRRPAFKFVTGEPTDVKIKVKPVGRNKRIPDIDKYALPMEPCRTRFAPSPTGHLHLGGLRTALYSYLIARATGGQFILRIEDTDQSRLVKQSEQTLLDDLRWAGLTWDEGPDKVGPYGPYRQSERLPLYHKHADQLLQEGKAYRCFCTPADLEARRLLGQDHDRDAPHVCRSLPAKESDERKSNGEQFAVRFRSSKDPAGFWDIVFGPYKKAIAEEDFIIMKRDGFPTYHLANVIDDHYMKITHVVRGAEWLISTPKHIELYKAFDWTPPQFAHLGLLVDKQRQKLSKRHKGCDMSWYRANRTLPAALLNFAVLMGWRKANELKDTMTLQNMVDNFSFQLTKGDIMVAMDKLPLLQKFHLRALIFDDSPEKREQLRENLLTPMALQIKDVEAAKLTGQPVTLFEAEDDTATTTITIHPETLGQLITSSAAITDLEDYILKVIRLHSSKRIPGTSNEDLTSYVFDNRYLFWDVPDAVLRDLIAKHYHQTDASSSLWLNDGPVQSADIISDQLQKFRAVTEENWAAEALQPLIDAAGNAVLVVVQGGTAAGGGVPEKSSEGFRLLRWAVAGMTPGPTILMIMNMLGREQTIRRLEQALIVARQLDDEKTKSSAGGDPVPVAAVGE